MENDFLERLREADRKAAKEFWERALIGAIIVTGLLVLLAEVLL